MKLLIILLFLSAAWCCDVAYLNQGQNFNCSGASYFSIDLLTPYATCTVYRDEEFHYLCGYLCDYTETSLWTLHNYLVNCTSIGSGVNLYTVDITAVNNRGEVVAAMVGLVILGLVIVSIGTLVLVKICRTYWRPRCCPTVV